MGIPINEDWFSDDTSAKMPKNVEKILNANIKIFDDAVEKITKEGCVVRDSKGNVLIHPSLEIQLKTSKIILEISFKYP